MADGRYGIFDLLKAHAKEARIGAGLGLSGSFSFLFLDATNGGFGLGALIIKLLFMCLSTCLTAVIGAWSKDMYDNIKQFRKKKEHEHRERRQKTDRDRAA